MTGTITELVIAALVFVGSHFLIASTKLRADLVGRLGERAYVGLYSAVALILLAWLIRAYNRAPEIILWWPPAALIILPLLVMPVALFLIVCGLSQVNPTAVGQGRRYAAERPAPGVLAITRHPVLWGFGLWALSHILISDDVASLILFASIAFLALYGTRIIDAKKQRSWNPEDWQRFSAVTSSLPFAALASSRNHLHFREIGWWRLLLTGLLYILLVLLHGVVLGLPVLVDVSALG